MGFGKARKGGQFPMGKDTPRDKRKKARSRRGRGRVARRAVVSEESKGPILDFVKRTGSRTEGNKVFVDTKQWNKLAPQEMNQILAIALGAGIIIERVNSQKKP